MHVKPSFEQFPLSDRTSYPGEKKKKSYRPHHLTNKSGWCASRSMQAISACPWWKWKGKFCECGDFPTMPPPFRLVYLTLRRSNLIKPLKNTCRSAAQTSATAIVPGEWLFSSLVTERSRTGPNPENEMDDQRLLDQFVSLSGPWRRWRFRTCHRGRQLYPSRKGANTTLVAAVVLKAILRGGLRATHPLSFLLSELSHATFRIKLESSIDIALLPFF